MIVVGIDLSMGGTGIASANWTRLIAIKAAKGAEPNDYPLKHERFGKILQAIDAVLFHNANMRPDLIVMEGPSYASKGQSGHDIAGLWWRVVAWILDNRIPLAVVPPQTLKAYALGYADKKRKAAPEVAKPDRKDLMLQAATRAFTGITHAFGNDEADALWLAAMGYDHIGQPICTVPAANRAALDKVRWPELKGIAK